MLRDHMMFFGYREFLQRHIACMDGTLRFFKSDLDERGSVGKIGGPNGMARYWSFY